VHRRGHGRDPAQLRGHERAQGRAARERRLEVVALDAKVLQPTFTPSRADAYRAPGGAWDRPSLDELLTSAASPALAAHVARVAGGLRARGAEPGHAVAWQSVNRSEVDVLYRACWRLGAIAAPLHHQAGGRDRAAMLDAVRPTVTLDDLDRLPDGPPVHDTWPEREQLAAVLFTSGTSGAPKGVLHTQATLAYKAHLMAGVHGLGPDDCVLMPAPLAHISGLLNGITLPGVVPFRRVLMSRWDPDTALDLIERERVTFMVGPPTFFVSMMHAESFSSDRVATLRLVSSGGAGVSEAFVAEATERLGARVKRTYGSTEAPTVATSSPDDGIDDARRHDGRAIGEVELRIGHGGELQVRGPEVCVGYVDATQTSAAFTDDGWFRTGDLAEIDTGGWLTVTGRINDVVIRGGENISTTEVEQILEAHPEVRAAVAVGYPDELMGERVAAFVVAAGPFDLDACQAWFERRGTAKFKTPERVIVVDALPVLPSGKPDRAALRARLLPGSLPG
jgi:cyclohexanecarboxylate-CoA ligase